MHNNQEVALVTRLMFKIVGKLLTCEQGIYFSRVRGNNHLFLPETRASLCGLKIGLQRLHQQPNKSILLFVCFFYCILY